MKYLKTILLVLCTVSVFSKATFWTYQHVYLAKRAHHD